MESNIQKLAYFSSFAVGSFFVKALIDRYGTVPLDFFYSSIEVYSHDEAYNYLLYWLISQRFDQNKNRLIASTSLSSGKPDWYSSGDDDEKTVDFEDDDDQMEKQTGDAFANTRPLIWAPSTGTHYFRYQGRYLSLTRDVEEHNTRGYVRTEKLRISCLGWGPSILKELMTEARVRFSQKEKGKTVIYSASKGPYGDEIQWSRTMSRPARPLSTVFLGEEQKESFLRDVQQYLHPHTRRWYSDRGIPYRRGYLFHGPPGTGKSSLAFAAAGFLGLNIYIINLNSKHINEDHLSILFQSLPRKCLVLLEDIDSNGVTIQRTSEAEKKKKGKEALSLSGLLNIIDGVAAQEGRVLIMTTNHFDQLDPALVRPGRVDYHIEFPLADRDLTIKMFQNFFAGTSPAPGKEAGASDSALSEVADLFAGKIPEDTFSPAEIQGFLLENKTCPDDAMSNVESWVERRLEAIRLQSLEKIESNKDEDKGDKEDKEQKKQKDEKKGQESSDDEDEEDES